MLKYPLREPAATAAHTEVCATHPLSTLSFFSLRLPLFLAVVMITIMACAGTDYRRAAQLDNPQEYQRFLQAHPNGAYAEKTRSDLERWRAFDAARMENSIEAYQKFIELYPAGETARRAEKSAHALDLINQAQQAASGGKKDEAGKLLTEAASADPDNVGVLTRAGTLALENGRADVASAWLGEAVRLDPKDYRTRTLLVAALLKAGRTADGIEEARAVLVARPDDVAIRKILSDIFTSSGLYESAALVLEDAVRISKYDPEIVLSAAKAQLSAGNPSGALELLTRIPANHALNDDANFIRGECYLTAGDHNRAHEAFLQYISRRPDDPQGYYRDGVAMERMGKWREAIERYEQAIRLDPSNSTYLWRIAISTLLSGDKKQAVKFFSSYLNQKPQGPRADMARRIASGQFPGFEGIMWGTESAVFSKSRTNVKCESSSGDNICCETQPAEFNGFKGKRCFVFKGNRLAEVRFEAQIGNLDNVKKIDPLIKELKSRYNGPISEQPRVSHVMTGDEAITTSEIAWTTADGIVVLTVTCANKEESDSKCDLRITWAPG